MSDDIDEGKVIDAHEDIFIGATSAHLAAVGRKYMQMRKRGLFIANPASGQREPGNDEYQLAYGLMRHAVEYMNRLGDELNKREIDRALVMGLCLESAGYLEAAATEVKRIHEWIDLPDGHGDDAQLRPVQE